MAQKRKLERSGLERLFDGIFISDEVGFEKPNVGFFDYVWERIGTYEKDQVLIVGDSLSSDMLGGNRAGIRCCWYNPERKERAGGVTIDYEITDLRQVKELSEIFSCCEVII